MKFNYFFALHSTQIYSKDQNDLKNEFVFHNYQIKIYDMHTKIRSFSKGKVHKNMKFLNFFEKNEEFFFAWHTTKICSRYKDDLKSEF